MKRFLTDDSAQGLVEYALILTFVALAAIVALRLLGGNVSNSLNNSTQSLS